jgi:hypothetical protein
LKQKTHGAGGVNCNTSRPHANVNHIIIAFLFLIRIAND